MGSISHFAALVFCLVAVEAFPGLHGQDEYGYVMYSRRPCVPAPSDSICKLDYLVSSVMLEKSTLESVQSSIMLGYQSVKTACPDCAEEYKKLFCRQVFPKCLPGGMLDYGDRKQAVASCQGCPFKEALFKGLDKTGLQRDLTAPVCKKVPQDEDKICPKPKYKMLSSYADLYQAQVQKVVHEMGKEKNDIPPECYQMGIRAFACTGVFCSKDGESVFMTTTRQKCFDIGVCMKKYNKYTDDVKAMLKESCPKYPDERTAKKIKLLPED